MSSEGLDVKSALTLVSNIQSSLNARDYRGANLYNYELVERFLVEVQNIRTNRQVLQELGAIVQSVDDLSPKQVP